MVSNCEICGQFTGRVSKESVRFRGIDKRGETEIIETGVSDVFIGECCGLELIESDGVPEDRQYQSYLNGADDGELRYVLLVDRAESVEPSTVEVVTSSSAVVASTSEIELEGTAEVPITGCRLPESVREHLIGKIETDG